MKKIYFTLSILIIALIALSIFWKSSQNVDNGITIQFSETTKYFSFRQLQKIEHKPILTIEDREFSGFKLAVLLTDIPLDETKLAIFSSKDGMSVSIPKKEFTQSYLCIREKNDEKFYQLVVNNDQFSQRWIKYVNRITLK